MPAIVVRLRMTGVESDGAVERAQRLARLPRLQERETEIVVGDGVAGRDTRRAGEARERRRHVVTRERERSAVDQRGRVIGGLAQDRGVERFGRVERAGLVQLASPRRAAAGSGPRDAGQVMCASHAAPRGAPGRGQRRLRRLDRMRRRSALGLMKPAASFWS